MTGILPYYPVPRKIAANEHDQLGDTSTLADPAVVDDLVENRQNR
jgi:acetyl-CoA synthetase